MCIKQQQVTWRRALTINEQHETSCFVNVLLRNFCYTSVHNCVYIMYNNSTHYNNAIYKYNALLFHYFRLFTLKNCKIKLQVRKAVINDMIDKSHDQPNLRQVWEWFWLLVARPDR